MDWTDIIIRVAIKDLDTASAIAQMAVPRGIYVEDYSNLEEELRQFGPVEIIEETLLQQDRAYAKIHIYFSPEENSLEGLAFLQERLNAAGISYETEKNAVREDDWANNWKQYFKPCPVGEKLLIVPSWENDAGLQEKYGDRAQLIIDPGMAFGSGQHETTRLCMALIEKNITPESTVLDIGTGSGILAIAALLLGAKTALGIDIDSLSVKIAAENADLNGVASRFEARHGDLARDVSGKYRLITANIVADIIIQLIPDAVKLLAEDGTFIVSGIIEERAQDVLDALAAYGLSVTDGQRERGWCAFAVKKK